MSYTEKYAQYCRGDIPAAFLNHVPKKDWLGKFSLQLIS